MSTKTLNVRTKQKHDTESNWLKATGFTPLDGELIVYDVDETHSKPRLKIGNGDQNVNLLPFISSDIELQSGTNVEINKNEDGSYTINATYTYTLPQATEENLGGIKIGYTQEGKNYPIVLDTNGKAYVYVPWIDTNTHQNAFSQVTITDNSNSSTIEANTSTDTLTIQVGSGLNATTNITGDKFILSAEVTKSYVDEIRSVVIDNDAQISEDTLIVVDPNATPDKIPEWYNGTLVTGIGSGIQAVVDGSDAGDYYVNTSTLDLFYAIAPNTWKRISNLKGVEQYPVGSIYISTMNSSPASWYGGTWQQLENVFLLAAGSKHTIGETGGEETHTLTIDEMPKHNHSIGLESEKVASGNDYARISSTPTSNYPTNSVGGGTNGETVPHNNMPPYLTVYMWKRVE